MLLVVRELADYNCGSQLSGMMSSYEYACRDLRMGLGEVDLGFYVG